MASSYLRALILLLLMSLVSGPLQAQAPQPLTEEMAVRLASQNQPMVRAAQAEAAMARARAGMARAEGRLQLSLNALAVVSDMVNAVQVPATMPQAILLSQAQNSVDLNVMAMLPIATGGRIGETVGAAEQEARAAESRSAAVRVQAAYEARAQFSQWRAALAMATIAESALAAQQQETAVARQLYEAGKIPQFDLLRDEAALAAAQQQATNAAADVAAARARLAQALGVAVATLPERASAASVTPAPADALAVALTRRPDLLAAAQDVAAAEATLRAREGSYLPQLYAFGMVDVVAPSDMGKNTSETIGIVAGLPLVTGGRRSADLAEARAGVTRAQAMRDSAELRVRADVAEAEARLAAARQNIETADAQVRSAQASYAVARERYAAGKSTVVELLDALRAQTEAQQSLVIAQTQYSLRLAELYRAMGIDVP